MYKVAAAEKLNDHYATFEVEGGDLASRATAGQIVLAAIGESHPLPCPITAVSADRQSITLLAAWNGAGDAADMQIALDGPFGGNAVDKASRVLCVAEGIGVGTLVSRLEAYKARDAYTIVVAAYRSATHIYWRDLLDGLSDELYIVTEDGSFGIKGPVRDTVKAICETVPDIERVVVIGSINLLKACTRIAETAELPLTVGLAAVADPSAAEGAASDDALREFDWSRSELDGHKTDFDELTRQLGLQPAK